MCIIRIRKSQSERCVERSSIGISKFEFCFVNTISTFTIHHAHYNSSQSQRFQKLRSKSDIKYGSFLFLATQNFSDDS